MFANIMDVCGVVIPQHWANYGQCRDKTAAVCLLWTFTWSGLSTYSMIQIAKLCWLLWEQFAQRYYTNEFSAACKFMACELQDWCLHQMCHNTDWIFLAECHNGCALYHNCDFMIISLDWQTWYSLQWSCSSASLSDVFFISTSSSALTIFQLFQTNFIPRQYDVLFKWIKGM